MKYEYVIPELEVVKFTVLNSVLDTSPTSSEEEVGQGGDYVGEPF